MDSLDFFHAFWAYCLLSGALNIVFGLFVSFTEWKVEGKKGEEYLRIAFSEQTIKNFEHCKEWRKTRAWLFIRNGF